MKYRLEANMVIVLFMAVLAFIGGVLVAKGELGVSIFGEPPTQISGPGVRIVGLVEISIAIAVTLLVLFR